MNYLPWFCCIVALVAAPLHADDKPAPLALQDGDRVAFVGNDFFDRDVKTGYIETALTLRYPKSSIVFRNLGYSGDTVWADARTLCSGWDAFGPDDQGFQRLKKLLGEIKPTVILVAYGMNESFAGKAGLGHFIEGLNRMIDMLKLTEARVILISPIAHENLGAPFPDPSAHNADLKLYVDAMEKVAEERQAGFINLFEISAGTNRLTSDGIHPTSDGYRLIARELAARSSQTSGMIEGGLTKMAGSDHLHFSESYDRLPDLFGSSEIGSQDHHLWAFTGLPHGRYVLREDGKKVASGDETQWAKGISVVRSTEQTERLRAAINKKNADFFNYWRPTNDTYIFGYRKHEQGKNSVEIPHFLPLAEEDDKKIAELRVPEPHAYTLSVEN